MKLKIIPIYTCLLLLLILTCHRNPIPKPKGYFRISLPEKEYQRLDMDCPYSFDYPVYGNITKYKHANEPCWFNIDFPAFNCKIHITYKTINNNLNLYMEDIRTFAYKHLIKADDIIENTIYLPEQKSFGILYDIKGNTATSINFFITDSTSHFLSGSLYFNVKPNIDSLKPVINFFRKDIEYLIQTIEWK
jgi:gliding motility-associated lipoprotein GldD